MAEPPEPTGLRELFGGAITVDLPTRLVDVSDFRPVPDNQEVWTDADRDEHARQVRALGLSGDEAAMRRATQNLRSLADEERRLRKERPASAPPQRPRSAGVASSVNLG